MNNNPEMVTNAKQLRERFTARAMLYMERMRAIIGEHVLISSDDSIYHAKMMYVVNQEALIAVIACYGDVTNMTLDQACTALGINRTMLNTLL